jgi:hypothetical protein
MGASRGTLASLMVHMDEPEEIYFDDYRDGENLIKNESGVLYVRPSQCRPLLEVVKVCSECGWPASAEHSPDRPWDCDTCSPHCWDFSKRNPNGCREMPCLKEGCKRGNYADLVRWQEKERDDVPF